MLLHPLPFGWAARARLLTNTALSGFAFKIPLKDSLDSNPVIPHTFNRSTVGTYVDDSIVIDAAIDEPRFETDGVLMEDTTLNSEVYSADFTSWTESNVALVKNSTTSPDGGNDGVLMTCTSVAGDAIIYKTSHSITATKYYTGSVYAKKGVTDYVSLTYTSVNFPDAGHAIFNLDDGTVDTVISGSAKIVAAGNGWFKCSFTVQAAVSGTSRPGCIITPSYSGADRGTSVIGNSVYIWQGQFEEGQNATSAIYTGATGVTRSKDSLEYDVDTFITQGEGAVYCEFTHNDIDGVVLDLNDGTADNTIQIRGDAGELYCTIKTAGVTQAEIKTSYTTGVINKALISYEDDAVSFYLNGLVIPIDIS